ncbi:MAG: 3'-5' exonuclease [Geobacter sp.]|nr:3'-5' exonuclease [Geobacter sp.]
MYRIVVVDTETTGLSVKNGGRVIEIGAVAVENGQIVAELATLINTNTPISYGAWRVHGISEQMLAGKPAPKEVWPWFLEFIGNCPLVAHNAPFDRAMINHELHLLGMPFENPWHCTVRLSRRKLPRLQNHKLETVYRHLFGKLPEDVQQHRALDDARMAARVWMELGGEMI